MIIFGGGLGNSSPCANDTWVLSNANSVSGTPAWTQLSPTGGPPAARLFHAQVYDPTSNRMIVFGGNNCFSGSSSDFFNDVWVLSNANGLGGTPVWTQLSPSGTAPAAREEHSAVYDSTTNRLIVFGGTGNSGVPMSDVWVLTNANGMGGTPAWAQLSPSGSLARTSHGATYDSLTNRMIVAFGDNSSAVGVNDTWILTNANGTGGPPAWSQLSVSGTLPTARQRITGALDYNSATNQLVVFAGANNSGGALNDTWVLSDANGTSGGGQTSTVTLGSAPNPATFGHTVTLTATVSPSAATGKVTFYDGVNVLGIATLSNGQGTLSTVLLPSGNLSLKAYYGGDATYAASSSATVAQTVFVLPQSGFQTAVTYNVGNAPVTVATGDFNGDGRTDLAVTNGGASGNVSILLGNGNGTFQAAVNYTVGSNPDFVAVGDFNGDGKVDLAVTNGASSGYVSILLGNGDGTFQPAVSYPVGIDPYTVVVGDFNGDGKADLAVVNLGSNSVSVFLGNGDGTFQPAVSYNVGSVPYAAAIGDFNGDGKADLVVANGGSNSNNVSVLLGNGNGTFQTAVNYNVGTHPTALQ
jgi:hypothetical protein